MELSSTIRHVLLADDDHVDRKIFIDAIAQLPLKIHISQVNDGAKVISFLADKRPDIIFLDVNMPNKNGVECLSSIKNRSEFASIPVIMYSTSKNPLHISETFKLGANGYVIKPYLFESFVNLLHRLLTTDWERKKHSKDEYILYS